MTWTAESQPRGPACSIPPCSIPIHPSLLQSHPSLPACPGVFTLSWLSRGRLVCVCQTSLHVPTVFLFIPNGLLELVS